ncbi:hypothetical protein Taro_028203 [Colocasia esculenta]|uniref:Transcription repressor n=1 Tax=Colocasia esculenta TaxID=4460 RepID=A0A843VTJ3_COLES|nr:hypothetical protein [Colocasia esculenta]
MGFPSLFKKTRGSSPPSLHSTSWAWPSCNLPKTQSFRADEHWFAKKTPNSAYLETSESWFTNSSEELASDSFSTSSEGEYYPAGSGAGGGGPSSMEAVIRALRSDPAERLFFEPGGTSSILEASKPGGMPPFEESVVMAVDSEDPYWDFRLSMEEMVAAHGLSDWGCLEALLEWYLRVNGKTTHGFIVGAFVDLLLELSCPASNSSCRCCSCSVSFEVDEEDDVEEEGEGEEEITSLSC